MGRQCEGLERGVCFKTFWGLGMCGRVWVRLCSGEVILYPQAQVGRDLQDNPVSTPMATEIHPYSSFRLLDNSICSRVV